MDLWRIYVILVCYTSLIFAGLEEDMAEIDDYYNSPKTFIVRLGLGTGVSHGGIIGTNVECGYSFVSLLGSFGYSFPFKGAYNESIEDTGNNRPSGKPTWQVGLRFYLVRERESLRPTLSVFYGTVYRYYVSMDDYIDIGHFKAVSPTISVEHDIGKKKGITLSYGAGISIHKRVPEITNQIFKSMNGTKVLPVGITVICGISYSFKTNDKKSKNY